jgi:NAD(P)-dependent dehydrogenase (short-subunit alcohol dehydrogenase family)
MIDTDMRAMSGWIETVASPNARIVGRRPITTCANAGVSEATIIETNTVRMTFPKTPLIILFTTLPKRYPTPSDLTGVAKRFDIATALILGAGAAAVFAARSAMQKNRRWEFRGKVTIITGSSRGLGLVLAREFAREGAKLVICARDAADLEDARRNLEGLGAEVLAVPCDLRDPGSVEQMARQVMDRFGRIDVLVNNAGTIVVGPAETMTLDDYREQMDSNYWSAVHATLAVLPHMKQQGSGRIVNITSIGGKVAVPHLLPYCASKFAFVGFSRGMRAELYKDGIVVTTVVPGLMQTGSPRNADFKGKHKWEYAWFTISDSTPGLSMEAEAAARQIIDAACRGDVEIILSVPAKAGAMFDALLPELSGDLLAIAARVMPGPGGAGTARLKGYESESELAPSPLTARTEQAARRNNEV